jgi:plastocyanin
MKYGRLWQFGLLSIFVVLLLLVCGPGSTLAEEKVFHIVTGEWKWKAKKGEAPVVDRSRGEVNEIERYVFNPGFIVVNKGDHVVLHIHDVKGDKHQVEIRAFAVKETLIKRGEMKTISFVADKTGTFKMTCNNHVDQNKEGPMEAYIYVLDYEE